MNIYYISSRSDQTLDIPKIIAGDGGTFKKDKDFCPYICYYLNLNYYVYKLT